VVKWKKVKVIFFILKLIKLKIGFILFNWFTTNGGGFVPLVDHHKVRFTILGASQFGTWNRLEIRVVTKSLIHYDLIPILSHKKYQNHY